MADFESLVQLEELKTTFLQSQPSAAIQFHLSYDPIVDDFMLLYTSNEVETGVFTHDDYVGLLYLPNNLEVVGVYIEDVKFGFLDEHPDLAAIWKEWELLGDAGHTMRIEAMFKLARGVLAAVRERFTDVAPNLVAVLA